MVLLFPILILCVLAYFIIEKLRDESDNSPVEQTSIMDLQRPVAESFSAAVQKASDEIKSLPN